jgi:hypothetical protein
VTTLLPGMAGTVKFPEPVFVGEVAVEELVGCEAVAVTGGLVAAECVCVGEAAGVGVPVYADVGAAPGAVVVADPLVTDTDGTVEGFDPLAAHPARPAPPMTTAMITAGTRHILMTQPLR